MLSISYMQDPKAQSIDIWYMSLQKGKVGNKYINQLIFDGQAYIVKFVVLAKVVVHIAKEYPIIEAVYESFMKTEKKKAIDI